MPKDQWANASKPRTRYTEVPHDDPIWKQNQAVRANWMQAIFDSRTNDELDEVGRGIVRALRSAEITQTEFGRLVEAGKMKRDQLYLVGELDQEYLAIVK